MLESESEPAGVGKETTKSDESRGAALPQRAYSGRH